MIKRLKKIKRFFRKNIIKIRKSFHVFHYFLFSHYKNIRRLSSYGLTNIRPYCIKLSYRHIGVRRKNWIDNSVRRYYTATLNGKQCFVKTMTASITAQNELFVNKYFDKIVLNCVPKPLLIDENYMKDIYLLVTDFKPDMRNFFIPEDEKDFEDICKQLEEIHSAFHEFNIIHLDLHDGNVLIDKDNRVVIIDFGMVWMPGAKNYPLKKFYYKGVPSGDDFVYDNAYYFIEIFDECGISDDFKQKECYKRIERLVGMHTYTIKL